MYLEGIGKVVVVAVVLQTQLILISLVLNMNMKHNSAIRIGHL
jgi:hypothetical protein